VTFKDTQRCIKNHYISREFLDPELQVPCMCNAKNRDSDGLIRGPPRVLPPRVLPPRVLPSRATTRPRVALLAPLPHVPPALVFSGELLDIRLLFLLLGLSWSIPGILVLKTEYPDIP